MTASAWTDDRIGRLRTLWLQGRSARFIAHDLGNGITRSAVLGKVHRLHLSRDRAEDPGRPAAPPLPARSMSRAVIVGSAPSVEFRRDAPVPTAGLVTLQSVRRLQCRWPVGDPQEAGFRVCGRTVARGAYCGPHGGLAYRPARDTAQTLERLARLD